MRATNLILSAVVACLAFTASAHAQGSAEASAQTSEGKADKWYYQTSYEKPTPQAIIQRKAQVRAMARIHRIETNKAYGINNARPTALATPYTGVYSATWQMPGGRPFGWYSSQRPQYIFWR